MINIRKAEKQILNRLQIYMSIFIMRKVTAD